VPWVARVVVKERGGDGGGGAGAVGCGGGGESAGWGWGYGGLVVRGGAGVGASG
ncbi:hypothetical protein HN51_015024, partial [Arachis hypogaea]